MQESLDRIEQKVDRIDQNLTSHLGRISVLEESVNWLKGHVKITITVAVSITMTVLGILLKFYIK